MTSGMDPVAALERIAYLMDRDRRPARRVRVFLRAADTLRGLPEPVVQELAAADRLEELAGVGPVISGIITEALSGEVPGYLRHLEEETVLARGPGDALRATLRGDCHTHTGWSDGGAPLEGMALAGQGLGHEYTVITDHSARLQIARGLSPERLRAQLAAINDLNTHLDGFTLLSGCEVDILEDGGLDDPEGMLAGLDVVVASVHSKLRMPAEDMTPRMLAAVADPDLDILGHCTGRLVTGRGRPPSEFDAEAVFAAIVEHGKALEVNCRPERVDPPDDLLMRAVELGCLFSVGTDAHAPGQLEWLALGCDRLAPLGISPERIVNSWPRRQLLEWTASHGAPSARP